MTDIRTEITDKLLDMIARKGPIGWYAIEHSFNIPRAEFPRGTSVFYFLDELEAKGEIKKDENDRYVRAKTV